MIHFFNDTTALCFFQEIPTSFSTQEPDENLNEILGRIFINIDLLHSLLFTELTPSTALNRKLKM